MAERFIALIDQQLAELSENDPFRAFLLEERRRGAKQIRLTQAKHEKEASELARVPFSGELQTVLMYVRALKNHTRQQAADELGVNTQHVQYTEDYGRRFLDESLMSAFYEYVRLSPAETTEYVAQVRLDEQRLSGQAKEGIESFFKQTSVGRTSGQHYLRREFHPKTYRGTYHIDLSDSSIPHAQLSLNYAPLNRKFVTENMAILREVVQAPLRRYLEIAKR